MNEEVPLTLDVHEHHVWSDIGKDYSWWKNLSEEARMIPENMLRLTVSFDMGWQQRSSGKFNSNSGHAFCIGGYSKKILYYCVKSKVCNIGSDLNISLKHWYVYMADVWGSWSTTHYRCLPRAIIPLACLQMFHSALL